MYTVEVHHHKKGWRNGDLEDAFELNEVKNFKTRAIAKEYIETQLKGKSNVIRNYHKDRNSYCYYFTGMIWTNENTGEKMQEYYQYTLKKTLVN